MATEYITIKLPRAMADEVERIIAEYPQLGYASKQSFVADAVRHRIEELTAKGYKAEYWTVAGETDTNQEERLSG